MSDRAGLAALHQAATAFDGQWGVTDGSSRSSGRRMWCFPSCRREARPLTSPLPGRQQPHAPQQLVRRCGASPPTWVAESVEELESEMGFPAGVLRATVEVYNRHAEAGADPLLGKKAQWVRPIGTPLAAFDLRNRAGGFTLGGLKTDLDSRVLHVSGDPIPGLFAAGRCTSGICAGGYVSGASLGDGSFYGRRAGRGAAGS